jgi:predicted RNA-binding Zn-ribbon protein involved in translation (DUF1610 family)
MHRQVPAAIRISRTTMYPSRLLEPTRSRTRPRPAMATLAIEKKYPFQRALPSRIRYSRTVMAIKRPTKGKSTPSHKPIASAPLRQVAIRPPQQMVPGEVYVGWLCKNRSCGLVIASVDTASDDKPTAFDDQLTAIKCPHCGDEDLYRWSARGEHKYIAKSVA